MMETITGKSYGAKEDLVAVEESTASKQDPVDPIDLPPNDVIASVLPGMSGDFDLQGANTDFPYWIAYSDAGKTTRGGYAFIAKGNGYGGEIDILISI